MDGPWLEGQFLLAMPGMRDERFERAVIYMCAHSPDGAMGIMVNRAQEIPFPDLLVQLGIIEEEDAIRLPETTREFTVRNGGPVERSRGFVLHTRDYHADSSLDVTPEISLTATLDILRAITDGRGPARALMALGYSGWGPGQLEAEIADNGWLTCAAPRDLLFSGDLASLYERVLGTIGIDPVNLSAQSGRA